MRGWGWLLLVFWSSPVWCDTMRCEKMDGTSGMISNGDGKYRVLEVCGAPDAKEEVGVITRGEGRGRNFQQITVTLEAWHYRCGYGRFDKILHFQGNQLMRIDSGGMGREGAFRCF